MKFVPVLFDRSRKGGTKQAFGCDSCEEYWIGIWLDSDTPISQKFASGGLDWWFGIPGVPPSKNSLHRKIPEIQTTN